MKWFLESQVGWCPPQEAAEVRRREEVVAAATTSGIPLFSGYYTDCDEVSSHPPLGVMTGYVSDTCSDDEEKGGWEGVHQYMYIYEALVWSPRQPRRCVSR
jgi:hypothetical protein